MKPLFTVHAGEYLVGAHIEQAYPSWRVWVPSKDSGIDILVTDRNNRKTASIQVKFSKDFNPTHGTLVAQDNLTAAGWWTHDLKKIQKSEADFWIFVLPSFAEKKTNFMIIPPDQLLQRLKAIHGVTRNRLHSYFRVTKTKQCWEARGLPKRDQELVALGQFSHEHRDFSKFLNAWEQIERLLQ